MIGISDLSRGQTYLESFTPSKNQVRKRDPNVIIDNLAVAFRSVIIAKHLHRSNDLYAWSVGWYQNDGLLEMLVFIVRVVFPHNNVEFAAGIPSTRDIPFVTIDNNFVAVLPNRCLNIGCV